MTCPTRRGSFIPFEPANFESKCLENIINKVVDILATSGCQEPRSDSQQWGNHLLFRRMFYGKIPRPVRQDTKKARTLYILECSGTKIIDILFQFSYMISYMLTKNPTQALGYPQVFLRMRAFPILASSSIAFFSSSSANSFITVLSASDILFFASL